MRPRSAVIVMVVALAARHASAEGEIKLEVELGKTVEREVASSRGWFCDDPSLLTADVVTRDDHNVWIVTGAKLGATTCRVGTDPLRFAYVFEVRVVPKKPTGKPAGAAKG